MDPTVLVHQAMQLPARERALLADALLGSLDAESDRGVEAAWAAVAEERLAAYRRGEMESLEAGDVLREIRGRLAR